MSINRNAANKYIFNSMEEYALERIDRAKPSGNKYINISDEDKKFLDTAKVRKKSEILSSDNFLLVNLGDENYLVVIGDSTYITDDELLVEENLTAGIFIFIAYELKLKVSNTANYEEIYNNILFQQEYEEYGGHDFEELSKYFPNINIYKINNDSNLIKENLYNIIAYYLTLETEYRRLEFSNKTLEILQNMILGGCKKLPYHNIVQAILSSQWNHVFLETYRCIEHLFHVIALDKFYTTLNGSNTLLQVSKNVEEILGWKPKEESSVEEIFSFIPEQVYDIVEAVKLEDKEFKDMKTSKWYYQLRNSIAHFRPIHKPIKFSDQQWESLINANIKIIEYLYDKYDKKL